jgi:hypothetical protein
LTGILLWAGVVWTLSKLRERREEDFLVITGFALLWLTFSFITVKAPNYTRMLLTLPFVAYLAIRGVELVAGQLNRLIARRSKPAAGLFTTPRLSNLLVIGIVLWNLGVYADYVITGLVEREALGATSRYVQARSDDDDQAYFIAADKEHEFFDGGEPWHWEGLLRFLVGEDAHIEVVPTDLRGHEFGSGPFSVFMLKEVWQLNAACFTSAYPHRRVHPLTADGRYLAIEVEPTGQPIILSLDPCP